MTPTGTTRARGTAAPAADGPSGAGAVLRWTLRAALRHVPVLALGFAALVPLHTVWLEQHVGGRTLITTLVFFLGGLAGGFTAWLLAAPAARGRPWSARFSLGLAAHCMLVPLATAFVFFLQYRDYYAQWHHAPLSEIWFWQMGYTGAAAIYFFAVGAVQYMLPFGLPVLVAAGLLLARATRRPDA